MITAKIHIDQLSDTELVKQYQATDDKEIFVVLYHRYTHLVYGCCLKYLKDQESSKDAVMEIFEKLMTDLHRHKVEYFKSWLYMVAKNHCLMKLRKKGNQVVPLDEVKIETRADVESRADEHLISNQNFTDNNLYAAMGQLNAEQRKCIELFYLKEQSYQQIAVQTGYDLNKVKSYIQNGKRNLRIYLEQNQTAAKYNE